MKTTFLLKTARTVGLMAVLSVTVGSSLPQTVQAQTESVTLEEKISQWRADDIETSKVCNLVYEEEAEIFEGNYFFDVYRGLNLTDEQNDAYLTFNAQLDTETLEVYENAVSMIDPTAALSFMYTVDSEQVPPGIDSAIQAALDENPTSDQIAALKREFGQYGEFLGAYIVYLTPEQKAQLTQIDENFQAQMLAVMTPEQLPQYRENLAARSRIGEACDYSKHPSYAHYPAMGRVVDMIPELLQ